MKIDIITVFPEMFSNIFEYGIPQQAKKAGVLEINIHDLRNFTDKSYRQVDDRPFGGGTGMVLMPEPLFKAIESVKSPESFIINMSPSGKTLSQELSETTSKYKHLIIICGRYEGIDQRIIDLYVNLEVSVGNYVLSGGEIPAMILVDSVARLIPGAIKNANFNSSESFSDPSDRTKMDFPVYTRPAEFNGLKVPDVLLSGNHKEIEKWQESQRLPK